MNKTDIEQHLLKLAILSAECRVRKAQNNTNGVVNFALNIGETDFCIIKKMNYLDIGHLLKAVSTALARFPTPNRCCSGCFFLQFNLLSLKLTSLPEP